MKSIDKLLEQAKLLHRGDLQVTFTDNSVKNFDLPEVIQMILVEKRTDIIDIADPDGANGRMPVILMYLASIGDENDS